MSHEDQGTGYDPGAAGHELQGRKAKPKNPSLEQRYPPGCPDPEWCRGNGCYWRCTCAGDEFCGCAECKAFYAREETVK